MNKIPIIIDTDPGIDDAVAIAIAMNSEELDIKLITTVAGNVCIDYVTENTLKLLKFLGKKVPVAKGAVNPLIVDFEDASNVHGDTGLNGFDFNECDRSLLMKIHAVEAIKNTILKSEEKITIVAIGPLTNIALLFSMYPKVKPNIERIVVMGGSYTRGNKGVMSEFNIATDPEAGKIVFNSGVPIVMVGLEIGEKALVTPDMTDELIKINKVGKMFYKMFEKYQGGNKDIGIKMYDSCAIAYLLKPNMFHTVDSYVDVELNGSMTKGCTIVDLGEFLGKKNNTKVCLDIDINLFREWFIDRIKNCDV